MKKQFNTTKTKSKTPTSKTGQTFQNSCLECNKPFQGFTKGQKVCSDECLQNRARHYERTYKLRQLEQRQLEIELENAELSRQVYIKQVENEVMGCKDKLEVLAYMDVQKEYYENNCTA